jgi:hypothetical protein
MADTNDAGMATQSAQLGSIQTAPPGRISTEEAAGRLNNHITERLNNTKAKIATWQIWYYTLLVLPLVFGAVAAFILTLGDGDGYKIPAAALAGLSSLLTALRATLRVDETLAALVQFKTELQDAQLALEIPGADLVAIYNELRSDARAYRSAKLAQAAGG